MKVMTLPAFSDNYIFAILHDEGKHMTVVDPGQADPVKKFANETGRILAAILNTHHHADHTGGNRELLNRYPGIPVFGGAGDAGRIHGLSVAVQENDEINLEGLRGRVLDVPGHTRAHVAYFFPGDEEEGDLFSGDTVFGGTIGNLFEGTPEIMFESIRKIRSLPRRTRIWAAHEYTLQYVRESYRLDPENERLAARLDTLEASGPGGPTVPLLLEEECETNPFFRWDDPRLNAYLGTPPGLETFRRLCEIT